MKIDQIELGAPDFSRAGTLHEALQGRRSAREFKTDKLSLGHLSGVLWSAYGVNREDGKRTAPSAMALYPMDVYAVLPEAVYHYVPEHHLLELVAEGDFRELAGVQDYVYTAPLNLLYIANTGRYTGSPLSPEMYLFLAGIDAGHMSENVYLYCASQGLKAVVRVGARVDELMRALMLDTGRRFILAQTVGY
ncbi:SagB/ThcOx family dehydrogenase [Rikenella microfusus]